MTTSPPHPRLRRRSATLGALLGVDDPTELGAALDDLQTLLYRCGYHLDLARVKRTHTQLARRGAGTVEPKLAARRRGRPAGSANWAQRQLALGLATIWADHAGRAPTRRRDAYGTGDEHGPFRDFVICVLSALPKCLLATRKGHVPKVDYVVRVGIEAFKVARQSDDEAQRRGLLDASTWQSSAPTSKDVAPQ